VTLVEAVAQAEREQQRCVVLLDRDNRDIRRVYLAAGHLWVAAGNPECLEPYVPTILDLLHVGWESADDSLLA
jgi:hypothetical protein